MKVLSWAPSNGNSCAIKVVKLGGEVKIGIVGYGGSHSFAHLRAIAKLTVVDSTPMRFN